MLLGGGGLHQVSDSAPSTVLNNVVIIGERLLPDEGRVDVDELDLANAPLQVLGKADERSQPGGHVALMAILLPSNRTER